MGMTCGTVPSSNYNISSLYYFTFTQNHLHGNLLADVGFTLPNIKVFAGVVNNLIGSVPASLLNNASKLEILDFSLNGLTGTLPKNLRVLNSSNGIHGNIPVGIGNLANLTLIALEGNRLTDSLPYSLGTLPAQVSKLYSLGELVLSENNFSGVIPSSLGRCISLEKLHLDGNSFEGNIPQTLQNLRAFLDIDRSRNTCLDLEMKISYSEISKCTGGFGFVYKGTLSGDQSSVAVKVLNRQQRGAFKSFIDECQVRRSIRPLDMYSNIRALKSLS
ncbi:unnamed protein product [Sphenostylis stenocarpa]|uniref:Protein kinase domain-containing protein n=1 Tax=Sphenostylis stenocarpa TaxID=92480 RepID=A0AA86RLL5_9FABA|nr:unnamed protein product [Sphenostylis stenocarpa]